MNPSLLKTDGIVLHSQQGALNFARVDYSDPEEKATEIAKQSNNEIPNVKENGWTQDQENRQDSEQESYVETETVSIKTKNPVYCTLIG